MKPISITITVSALIIFFITNPLLGSNIFKHKVLKPEKLEIVEKEEGDNPLQLPWAFCSTEDDLFLVTDHKAGDVKIYEKQENSLIRIATLGEKGYGKDQFIEPAYCFFNACESKFGVIDFGSRKVFIYDRLGRLEFKRITSIYCRDLGYDIQLIGNDLVVSSETWTSNNEPVALYSISLNIDNETQKLISKQSLPLLNRFQKHGLNSYEEYKKKNNGIEIKVIGRKGFFDTTNDSIYYAWEGNLVIHKIDLLSHKHTIFSDQKSRSYNRPTVTDATREGYLAKDSKVLREERARMSYIRDVFTGSDYVFVVHEKPEKFRKKDRSKFEILAYDYNGNLVTVFSLIGNPTGKMTYNKEEDALYAMVNDLSDNTFQNYILRYSMPQKKKINQQ